ncbi:dTDP-4-dehydrorhamnose 3,5-epimerase family protein [Algoriphagus aestuariicola]|uniref:dTDP-4-dehydrorhamnose 3,5-epimerase family protein n=1 Tax=Algoriphagus aestuariicola TaxID=1852016 RepID=A0ABS3BKS7_9BACT|nr:dTDP-4-dehydrorhamnose 3,5-epimerase family protein [Algoriphagus aestuariicola]
MRLRLVLQGFVQGFVSLCESAVVHHKVNDCNCSQSDRGNGFGNPLLDIDGALKKEPMKLSEKDKRQPLFVYAHLFTTKTTLYE